MTRSGGLASGATVDMEKNQTETARAHCEQAAFKGTVAKKSETR